MLHELVRYASDRGLASEPGFKTKSVRWLVTFSKSGKFLGLIRQGDDKGRGRDFKNCPDLSQPEMKAGGSGCRHFLVDSLEVILAYSVKETDEQKLLKKHQYFVNLLRQASSVEADLGPIANSLADSESLEEMRKTAFAQKAGPMDSVTLAVQGSEHSIIVERSSWHDWWRGFRAELSGKRQAKKTGRRKTSSSSSQPRNGQMRCLLSGELIDPATTHGKIEGLRDVGGGKMGGDHLISFKQESFQSFGLRQAANAAMSEKMANVYRSTLKHLIANNGHRLAGSKVVYWYTGPSQEARELAEKHDPLGSMFGLDYGEAGRDSREQVPPQTPQARELRQGQANAKARDLLAAIRAGQLPGPLKDCRFCAVTLSGNAGRVVVRDWMEGEFEALASNVAAWFEDLRIISRDGSNDARNPKFTAVLFGMVRELKEMPAPLEAELWRCAVRNLPLPYQAMARALSRVRIDIITGESPTNARMGLLKAYLIRKGTQMEPSLMEGCKDPAYLSGRIMAVLADIQRAALGDVGAGVVQRYYAAASTTPALVLGRLVRLAQVGHLPKIDKGLQIWFDQQLADIWSRLTPQTLPKTLSLEQQTLFALGYYHQKASRKNGKDQEGQAALSAKA